MKNSTSGTPVEAVSILLIDDNKSGLLVRRHVLEEAGYKVSTASTPEDGLRQFNDHEYGLVITDYKMPRMNGAEVIAAIRKLRPDLPIVLVSGQVEAMGLTELNTGADSVIAKTANEVPQMLRAISRLLTRKAAKKPGRAAGKAHRKSTVG